MLGANETPVNHNNKSEEAKQAKEKEKLAPPPIKHNPYYIVYACFASLMFSCSNIMRKY